MSAALEVGFIDTERVVGLVAEIEDALGEAWEYDTNLDDDDLWTVLEERLDALLSEYEALDAEVEDR